QQQVGDHVADVARAVEGHRTLERRRQRVQLAAHARLELAEGRGVGGPGRDRRRILGMEVAAPVDVVAQELDDQLLQQRVVLAIGTEETGMDGRGGHDSSDCRMPSGWCARATVYMKPKQASAAR